MHLWSEGITKLIIKGNMTRDGRDWSASSVGRLITEERALGIRWIQNRIRPRAGLDIKKKLLSLRRESNHDSSVVALVQLKYDVLFI